MTPLTNNFRFIPYRRRDVVEMCMQDGRLPGAADEFRQFAKMLEQVFHFEFHQVVEALKNAYAGVDPDTDTRRLATDEAGADEPFVDLLDNLLEKANYEVVSQQQLKQALTESSLFKIRLQVDFDDFSEVLLYARGESVKKETITSWFGLRAETIEFINYDRVVIYIRFRQDYRTTKGDMPSCRAGATLLKLFRNVPRADLEMLFPNTRVGMRLKDKLLIGIPALVSGSIVLTTKLGASLIVLGSLLGYWIGISNQPSELNQTAILALLAGAGALGGYLWKQFSNFKNRKLQFMQMLTQNLYFKNLDNNAGVFHRLANDAEEEESKEAILAYYFLLISPKAMSKAELDESIECWFAERWHCNIDFEIEDALHKLLALDLVVEADEKLKAVVLGEGINRLDKRWDDYFLPNSSR